MPGSTRSQERALRARPAERRVPRGIDASRRPAVGRTRQGAVAILPLTSSLFPRRQVVAGDIDPGAWGRHRSLGESGPPRERWLRVPPSSSCCSRVSALRLTIAYVLFPASGFATDLASYASWALTLGDARSRRLLRQRRVLGLPARLPVPALARSALLAQRERPIRRRVASGAHQAAADARRHRRRLRALPARALGWAWPGRACRGASRSRRRRSTCSTRSPSTTRRSGARPTPSARWSLLLGVAALIRGNSEGAAALGDDGGAHQAAVRRRAHPARRGSCS